MDVSTSASTPFSDRRGAEEAYSAVHLFGVVGVLDVGLEALDKAVVALPPCATEGSINARPSQLLDPSGGQVGKPAGAGAAAGAGARAAGAGAGRATIAANVDNTIARKVDDTVATLPIRPLVQLLRSPHLHSSFVTLVAKGDRGAAQDVVAEATASADDAPAVVATAASRLATALSHPGVWASARGGCVEVLAGGMPAPLLDTLAATGGLNTPDAASDVLLAYASLHLGNTLSLPKGTVLGTVVLDVSLSSARLLPTWRDERHGSGLPWVGPSDTTWATVWQAPSMSAALRTTIARQLSDLLQSLRSMTEKVGWVVLAE